jgi:hypothetical protein
MQPKSSRGIPILFGCGRVRDRHFPQISVVRFVAVLLQHESLLSERSTFRLVVSCDRHYRVAGLQCPRVHHIFDVDHGRAGHELRSECIGCVRDRHHWNRGHSQTALSRRTQVAPQIVLLRAGEGERSQVRRHSGSKLFPTQKVHHHSYDGSAFRVRNVVENLADLVRMTDRDRDRMRRAQTVETKHGLHFAQLQIVHDLPLRVERLERLVRHVRSEAFVEPQIVPPAHRDQIAEPLMGQLVRHHRTDGVQVQRSTYLRLVQQQRFPVRDQTPVFHCTGVEVGCG